MRLLTARSISSTLLMARPLSTCLTAWNVTAELATEQALPKRARCTHSESRRRFESAGYDEPATVVKKTFTPWERMQ